MVRGSGLLVEICDLVPYFLCVLIDLDFHVAEGEAGAEGEEVVFEDLWGWWNFLSEISTQRIGEPHTHHENASRLTPSVVHFQDLTGTRKLRMRGQRRLKSKIEG